MGLGFLRQLAITGLLAAGPALAQEARIVVFAPLAPNEAQFAVMGPPGPFYPARAAEKQVGGRVVLRCTPTAEGRLRGCEIVSETPKDFDFGRAALVMAARGRITAPAPFVAGEPVKVSVPFVLGARY